MVGGLDDADDGLDRWLRNAINLAWVKSQALRSAIWNRVAHIYSFLVHITFFFSGSVPTIMIARCA